MTEADQVVDGDADSGAGHGPCNATQHLAALVWGTRRGDDDQTPMTAQVMVRASGA